MTAARGRLASAALAAALLGGVAAPVTILAPVAAAHSVLLSTDPADGAALDAAPDRVVLTFNEDINQTFASVAVTSGDDRTNLVVGEPVVVGAEVTAALDGLADGSYTVGFRVTSADGHVISGSSGFTVAAAPGAAAPGAAATSGAPATDAAATADPAATDEQAAETSEETSSGIDPALWVVGGLAVLLIGGALVLLRRGK
ncbi:copper resistance protein CopC [Rhodococcus sp. IEGM 1408]|uniref:copper resistance CopC family protein n=1 Tax=Rhodococcus sp. IEGM 1408 TaxID=3082220 RepID=UPI002955DA64|nr:copper resistance protein CopC [Rhodococcus sp. IEGM 1408]MDV8002056.1 copper resistance protein CopC [Rhodococcus sp. IEGM 1408]